MGFYKRLMEQQDDQGWSFTPGHVCAGCVDDYALAAAIESAPVPDAPCDFCGQVPAAALDTLLEVFVDGVKSEYGTADDEGVFYDGREGGYQWDERWDTWDLVTEEFADVLIGDGLPESVAGAMQDRTWVERNFIQPRRDEALFASWQEFCHAIMHQTRYLFFLREDHIDDDPGYIPAGRILQEFGDLVEAEGLIIEVPAGTRFWRARPHRADEQPVTARQLGTAPRDKAKFANRMSPAGIPMFYGALDAPTAVREIQGRARDDDQCVTYALFETSRPCKVVDLTSLPPPPSMFDSRNRHRRRPLIFLRRFVEDLRQPAKPEWEQLDYVPTQVVTEYLLRIRKELEIAGLQYRSVQTDGTAVVLDVSNDQCTEMHEGWRAKDYLALGLVDGSVSTQRPCCSD